MHPVFFNSDSSQNVVSNSIPSTVNHLDKPSSSTRAPISPSISTPEKNISSSLFQPQNAPKMAYARNLIGSLAQSPSKLKGLDGRTGIFFIFHDLSIRTEGIFTFRFVFLSLEHHGQRAEETVDVMASIFTEPFQVFSAKKFPGMLGPTPLTKHFAAQRVRIPTCLEF
ncbi:velvet factor [Phakopsora pachyrhizi]|nr:velvet factor [Phakopsora pachyrhizi]